MELIKAGDKILATNIDGEDMPKRAVSEPYMSTFQIVRVCREQEWVAAQAEGRAPRSVAWPAEDVRLTN